MATIKGYHPGEFCWTDLGTTDVAGTKKFYRGVLGLTAKDVPMDDEGHFYSLLRAKGKDVCAIYPVPPGSKQAKMRASWVPFIAVANVDRAVKKATAAGATLGLGPFEALKAGRMAVLLDPTGAKFALWQAREHSGAKVKGVPGAVCWRDLSTPDRKAAGRFYTKVFGWKLENMDFSGNPYHLFKVGGEGFGGMWPTPLPKHPPAWFTYWLVENCPRTVAKAKRRGGKVILGPITVPETCTFAIIRDPQGAAFGALEPLVAWG